MKPKRMRGGWKGSRPPTPLSSTQREAPTDSDSDSRLRDRPRPPIPSDGTRRFNLTLIKVQPSARERFRALDRPETYSEIRPGGVGDRVAYSVEMTQGEYEAALGDAENPESNLISIHPQYPRYSSAGVGGVPDQGALEYVAAQDAESKGLTGSGVIVGMLDSGLSTQLRDGIFSGRVAASADKSGGDGVGGPFNDEIGHGSEMASMAVPAKSRVAVAKINAEEGEMTDADVASGIYWLVDEVNVRIINCSLGGALGHGDVERDAVAHANSRGALFFAAAGNEHVDQVNYPARWPGALAITNYNRTTDSKVASSNYGPGVYAATGGVPITFFEPNGTTTTTDTGGTSSACAMATHVAALLATGGTSTGNVKKYLAETARKTGASPTYEGNGVLQLMAAYNKMKGTNPPKTNPDGSIPLPKGGQVKPTDGSIPGGLPPKTNVYPTGQPKVEPGKFILPEGGNAQFGDNVPLPEDYSGGPYPLGENIEIMPDPGTGIDPAPTPGACEEQRSDEGVGAEEPPVGYWVYLDEVSADAVSVLTSGENSWSLQTDGIRPWIIPDTDPCKFYDSQVNADKIAVLQGLGWWHTGSQLMRLCPPNSWWRTF